MSNNMQERPSVPEITQTETPPNETFDQRLKRSNNTKTQDLREVRKGSNLGPISIFPHRAIRSAHQRAAALPYPIGDGSLHERNPTLTREENWAQHIVV
jgi:hypothetical protein